MGFVLSDLDSVVLLHLLSSCIFLCFFNDVSFSIKSIKTFDIHLARETSIGLESLH